MPTKVAPNRVDYTTFEAVREAVEWLVAHGEIEIGDESLIPCPRSE